jgi:hypothetical protein
VLKAQEAITDGVLFRIKKFEKQTELDENSIYYKKISSIYWRNAETKLFLDYRNEQEDELLPDKVGEIPSLSSFFSFVRLYEGTLDFAEKANTYRPSWRPCVSSDRLVLKAHSSSSNSRLCAWLRHHISK